MKKNYFYTPFTFLTLIGVIALFTGCFHTVEDNTTFFGGKIKNPKGEYVYFHQGKKLLDSAKLNSQNRFSFHLDSIEAGLYTFNHGPEYQYLYLEPKDSLLIYLNTWDFDESLIFSGKGSAKNNYLINLYLEQEKNEKRFSNNYRLDEKEFSALIDKGIEEKLKGYEELIESEDELPSDVFDKLAKSSISFPYYTMKEYYPFYHKYQLKLKDFPNLSKDFYSYRKEIDLNNESLIDYAPYVVFLKSHLYNLAYTEQSVNPKKKNVELNFMNIVNDKIHIESFKNTLLTISLENSLTNKNLSEKDFKDLQKFFFTHCSNDNLKNNLKRSIEQKEQLKEGDTLPLIIAHNRAGNQVAINAITKNTATVIYFWPKDLARIEMLNEKLHAIKESNPDVLFIGIERNKNNEDWVKFIDGKKLTNDTQFNLPETSENYALFEGQMARTIIINKHGVIQNPYLFFNDKSFDKELKKLKKQ